MRSIFGKVHRITWKLVCWSFIYGENQRFTRTPRPKCKFQSPINCNRDGNFSFFTTNLRRKITTARGWSRGRTLERTTAYSLASPFLRQLQSTVDRRTITFYRRVNSFASNYRERPDGNFESRNYTYRASNSKILEFPCPGMRNQKYTRVFPWRRNCGCVLERQ